MSADRKDFAEAVMMVVLMVEKMEQRGDKKVVEKAFESVE